MSEVSTPPISLMRLDAVAERVGIRKTSIYDLVKRGKFPQPHHIAGTRVSVWSSAEVTLWIQRQLEEAA
jgi:prophage regulatory protein